MAKATHPEVYEYHKNKKARWPPNPRAICGRKLNPSSDHEKCDLLIKESSFKLSFKLQALTPHSCIAVWLGLAAAAAAHARSVHQPGYLWWEQTSVNNPIGATASSPRLPITDLPTPALLAFRDKMPSIKKTPTPLPPCPASFPAGSNLQRAFQVCKSLELKEQWLLFQDNLAHSRSESILLDLSPTCAGRVLGSALLYSPSVGGQDNLAAEILGCNDDHERLAGLAHLYVYGLIRVCMSSVAFCLWSC
jgi:hypothetical protein